ncbi:hypothetical protein [Nostoc sp.]
MPNTSLLRLRQRLLYETLRERYFSSSAAPTTPLLLFFGCANDAAQYKSVQVSTSAQCPFSKTYLRGRRTVICEWRSHQKLYT